MSAMPDPKKRSDANPVSEALTLIRDYAKQETLGPLKGVGRWIAFGLAGAMFIGIGGVLVLVGVLRVLQGNPGHEHFTRGLSWLPYLITAFTAALVTVLSVSRIRKTTLARKESR